MMKTVCNLDQCAGCMACVDICAKEAIKIEDSLSAYNAVIDEKKCISCNACHTVCQENNIPAIQSPIFWKEGWSEVQEVREVSSSGGMATALANAFIKNGGVVCSCSFQDGNFGFSFAEREEDVNKFTGSKYVKSNPKGIYRQIKQRIKNGQKILFIGLPCQVAAAKQYVKSEKLYTVDLICHGTPSPRLLDKFLREKGTSLKNTAKIKFRAKTTFGLENDSRRFSVPTVTDYYTFAFLNAVFYTENCYQCKYAQTSRVGDLTIGDSWGSDLPKEELKKGVSLILCQTKKGEEILAQAKVKLLDVNLKKAIEHNHQLERPSVKPIQRERFMQEIQKGKGFRYIMWKYYPDRMLKNIVKVFLYKIHTFHT